MSSSLATFCSITRSGAYVGENTTLDRNLILNSDHFGLALQDGDMTSTGDVILGGGGGVAVIASFVDTTATLNNIVIAGGIGTSRAGVRVLRLYRHRHRGPLTSHSASRIILPTTWKVARGA